MTKPLAPPPGRGFRSLAVPWPVSLVAGLMGVGLLVVSGNYGFHGDEMYYVVAGQHPGAILARAISTRPLSRTCWPGPSLCGCS